MMTDLMTYIPGDGEHDLLLASWWGHLVEGEDLGKVFTVSCASLSGFFQAFQAPCILYFAKDDKGIWFAMWAEPIMSGAFFGLWVREDCRGNPPEGHPAIPLG